MSHKFHIHDKFYCVIARSGLWYTGNLDVNDDFPVQLTVTT